MFANPLTHKIAGFLKTIGISIEPRQMEKETFLPGILIENGAILIDESKVEFPGDILHEAGHLAVSPGALRKKLSDEVFIPETEPDTIEAGAIAWSYAAAWYLGIDPQTVFHEGGYKGKSEALLQNFSIGVYIGANVLEEYGMTVCGQMAAAGGAKPYPHMLKWVRD
jgi:hypothetical protein